MGRAAVLIDLDDTLVVEEAAAAASFEATARAAAERHDLDARALARTARESARALWYAAPTHPYCAAIGISSWEGLWCRFEGDGVEMRALRELAPAYRRDAWRLALAGQRVRDDSLADELAERFAAERRSRLEAFADAEPALRALRAGASLALVTNGAGCLQREKLAASGLAAHFDAVVVSGDLGIGKPDAAPFARALSLLGAEAHEAVMVGDSLARDVDGAAAAGLDAVWLNRAGLPLPAGRDALAAISTLAELPALLG